MQQILVSASGSRSDVTNNIIIHVFRGVASGILQYERFGLRGHDNLNLLQSNLFKMESSCAHLTRVLVLTVVCKLLSSSVDDRLPVTDSIN